MRIKKGDLLASLLFFVYICERKLEIMGWRWLFPLTTWYVVKTNDFTILLFLLDCYLWLALIFTLIIKLT